MIERVFPAAGRYIGRVICPTGASVSAVVARSWVSVTADGGGTLAVYFQKSADTDGAPPGVGTGPWTGPWKNGMRVWHEVPNGTEYLWFDISVNGPGALCVEMQAA